MTSDLPRNTRRESGRFRARSGGTAIAKARQPQQSRQLVVEPDREDERILTALALGLVVSVPMKTTLQLDDFPAFEVPPEAPPLTPEMVKQAVEDEG